MTSADYCQKCRGRLIPDPQRLDAFMCSKCGAKHTTVFGKSDPVAGVS